MIVSSALEAPAVVAGLDDVRRFRERTDAIIRQVHESRRGSDVERLYVPGEIEAGLEVASADGIMLAAATVMGSSPAPRNSASTPLR